MHDIFNLEIGKTMQKINSGNPPDKFKQLFTPLNQIHSCATRNTIWGAFFWQAASNTVNTEKDLQNILAPKSIWDCIDLFL